LKFVISFEAWVITKASGGGGAKQNEAFDRHLASRLLCKEFAPPSNSLRLTFGGVEARAARDLQAQHINQAPCCKQRPRSYRGLA
jgi:hypothetical protein